MGPLQSRYVRALFLANVFHAAAWREVVRAVRKHWFELPESNKARPSLEYRAPVFCDIYPIDGMIYRGIVLAVSYNVTNMHNIFRSSACGEHSIRLPPFTCLGPKFLIRRNQLRSGRPFHTPVLILDQNCNIAKATYPFLRL